MGYKKQGFGSVCMDKKCMNMKHLEAVIEDVSFAG